MTETGPASGQDFSAFLLKRKARVKCKDAATDGIKSLTDELGLGFVEEVFPRPTCDAVVLDIEFKRKKPARLTSGPAEQGLDIVFEDCIEKPLP